MTIMRTGPTPPEAAPATGLPGWSGEPAGDAEALFREARRRRRRRRVGWALLAAAALVATIATVSSLGFVQPAARLSPHAARGTPPRRLALPVTMPDEIVGWTATARLVVVSARTGRTERTLATDVSVSAPGIPSVSVAPDGTVYFESATPAYPSPTATGGDQILSVSINGGPVPRPRVQLRPSGSAPTAGSSRTSRPRRRARLGSRPISCRPRASTSQHCRRPGRSKRCGRSSPMCRRSIKGRAISRGRPTVACCLSTSTTPPRPRRRRGSSRPDPPCRRSRAQRRSRCRAPGSHGMDSSDRPPGATRRGSERSRLLQTADNRS